MKNIPHEAREFLESIRSVAEANPFGTERPRLEAVLLGRSPSPAALQNASRDQRSASTQALIQPLEDCLDALRPVFGDSEADVTDEEKDLYRTGFWFWIYHRFLDDFDAHLAACKSSPEKTVPVERGFYEAYREDANKYVGVDAGSEPSNPAENSLRMTEHDVANLFAFSFQLRRAVAAILDRIVGISPAAGELREAVWEAIFTRRLLWSFRYLKDRMANFSTLILGPSGSGKDLVAEAIGISQFIPFLPADNRFAINFASAYQAVNLSAVTPTLIESELFGHEKGSFTGATSARRGRLEDCSPYGVLFLDEIGDLGSEIQVKLLRVLQSREFTPLGGGKCRRFQGRIVSATNRDISKGVAEGRMREDFLYRIGSNVIRLPSLSKRLAQQPDEAHILLRHVLDRTLGRADDLVYEEIQSKIDDLVARGYEWPGNVREFEQCVRTLLIASEYRPLIPAAGGKGELETLFDRMEERQASLGEVTAAYCSHVMGACDTYREAAARLDVDWRTVKKYAEPD